jgi:hypothetical protein
MRNDNVTCNKNGKFTLFYTKKVRIEKEHSLT